MNNSDCYRVLDQELHSFRERGFEALLSDVGKTVRHVVRIGQENIDVEISLRLHSSRGEAIRVDAVGAGPNWWTTERLEEFIIVRRP